MATAFIYCNSSLEKSILLFNYLFSLGFLYKDSGFIRSYPDHELAYNDMFLKQKHIFIPFVKAIWGALSSCDCEDELIISGLEADRQVKNALQALLKDNKLELSGIFENNPLWNILQSYMHMTNNRLGITPIDESLIYYYIMKSLEQI